MIKEDRIIQYKATFNSPTGKAVLDDLFRAHSMMRPTLPRNNDSLEMAYNEGQRAVVLRILHYLETDLDLMRERMSRLDKEVQDGRGDDY